MSILSWYSEVGNDCSTCLNYDAEKVRSELLTNRWKGKSYLQLVETMGPADRIDVLAGKRMAIYLRKEARLEGQGTATASVSSFAMSNWAHGSCTSSSYFNALITESTDALWFLLDSNDMIEKAGRKVRK